MTVNYQMYDPLFGSLDMDNVYITNNQLIDQFVGNRLFAVGQNIYGELGDGTIVNKSSPIQIGSLTNWSQVNGNSISGYGIKTDGSLWAWGRNNGYQLATGNSTNYSSPIQIGALTNWKSIASYDGDTGPNTALAIKTDGSLWAWGDDSYGNAGTGVSGVQYSSPVQIGSSTSVNSYNWRQVSQGFYNVAAVKTDGTLWAWGKDNGFGVAGQGNITPRSSPVQVGSLTTWKMAACGSQNFYAVKTDGTLWACGYNQNGNLGDNTVVHKSTPVQIGSLTNWKFVASGNSGALATKTDNTLWAWGTNNHGQLGQNNTINYSSPVQVGLLNNWKTVSGLYYGFAAVKTDGTLWACGYNLVYGQLGLGNLVDYSSPAQVGLLTNWKSVGAGNRTFYAVSFADVT